LNGQPIELTAREYALIEYLICHAGAVVTRRELQLHVWGDSWEMPASNVIDVYVQRLRRKLDPAGTQQFIQARRGAGYQLIVAADDEP
jgi:DNA-binding response OmpR family regulator